MWQPIQGWIVFKLGRYCYDIYVKEVGSEVYSRSCFKYHEQPKVKQVEESSGYESSKNKWQKEGSV